MDLQRLAADADLDNILAAIRKDGACILEDVLSNSKVDQILDEMGPYIDRGATGRDEFSGFATKRIGSLVARSAACREVTIHEKILGIANGFLGPQCERIQLHLGQIIDIMPGQTAQLLHRDRLVWGLHLPKEVEPQLNTIWALTDFTKENGATHVVPGSQEWPLTEQARHDQSIQANMSKGSVLLYTGTVIHGGGANTGNSPRLGLNITYCLGWLRTEENMMLSCPPEIAKDMPQELTDLLGYTMGNYALGYYSSPEQVEGRPDILPPEYAIGRRVKDRHKLVTEKLLEGKDG